jgi:predicted metal-dependent peptidase
MGDGMGDLRGEIKSIIASLTVKEPVIGIFLKRTWIYESEDYPMPAWTDGIRIYVNPNIFLAIPQGERSTVLAHEALHIFELHLPRAKAIGARGMIANVAADVKVNQHLRESGFRLVAGSITADFVRNITGVSASEIEQMSFEEIVNLLSKINKSGCCSSGEGGEGSDSKCRIDESKCDLKDTKSSGKVINEGDKEDSVANTAEEMERRARMKAVESVVVAKSAGKVPGWAERIVSEILKPKVDWRRALRAAIERGVGRKVRRTWMKPSRKGECFPGKDLLAINSVVVAVDTSGSISERELQQFLSEIYGICKEIASVIVIPWDANAYNPIKITRAGDVSKVKLTGGGGTVFLPVIKLLEKMRYDQLVILSDWGISDLYSWEVEKFMRENAAKIVAVTTYEKPPEFLKNVIRLEVRA